MACKAAKPGSPVRESSGVDIDSNLGKKAIKSVAWMGIATGIGQSFSWIVTIVVARLLTPQDYGLMAIATLLVGLCMVVSDLGLGSATIQRKSVTDDQLSGIFWVSMGVAICMYGIVFLGAPFIALFFHEPKATVVTRIIGFSLIFSTLKTIPYSLLTKEIGFKQRAKAQVIAIFCSGSISLCMAITGFGVWALVAASLIREAALTIACFWYKPWTPSFTFRFKEIRGHMAFGATIAGAQITHYFYTQVDNVIVGRILGPTTLGLFTMGRTLASIPNEKICNLVNQVAFPVFSKIQDDVDRIKKYIFKTLRLEIALILPLMVGGALTAYDLIPAVLSDKWVDVCPIFIVMCILAILGGPGALLGTVLLARGHASWMYFHTLGCSILYPIILYPVGLKWALPGLLTALLLLKIIVFGSLLFMCWIDLKISVNEYIQEIKPIIFATFIMAFIVASLLFIIPNNISGIIKLVTCCSFGATSYFISIRYLFPHVFQEVIGELKKIRE